MIQAVEREGVYKTLHSPRIPKYPLHSTLPMHPKILLILDPHVYKNSLLTPTNSKILPILESSHFLDTFYTGIIQGPFMCTT